MDLFAAAKHFDKDTCTDGYTGAQLFKAQFSSFDGASPDGSFARRRTVSVAPDVIPAVRRVVSVQGSLWLMGELVEDTFKDRVIRKTASAKLVTHSFNVRTPAEAALRTTTSYSVHAQSRYLKDTVNSNTNSDYDPQYEVSVASVETAILDGYYLKSGGLLLRIRSVYKELEGIWTLVSDELCQDSSAEVTCVFSGAFDPITESNAAGATTTGILMDMYKFYEFKTQMESLNRQGDMTLVVAKSAVTPVAGSTVTVGSLPYRIESFTSDRDAWNLHLRQA